MNKRMPATPPKTIRVFLIEDDDDYAGLVTLKLSKSELAHFQIECAASLTDFEQKIKQAASDVILSDLGLPESSGFDTFTRVNALAGNIPVVVLTGMDDGRAGVEAVRLGAQDYLIKTAATAGDMIAHSLLHAIERNRLRVELQQANEKLALLAVTDPLTGLLNRRGLEQALTRELAFKKRYGTDFYMVMIDLDDFKSINERFGHSTGDLALQQIAARMKATIRPTDYAARIGGDEFLVLLVQAKNESVLKVADRLRRAIGACAIHVPGQSPVYTTASAGLMDLSDIDVHLDTIIKKAGTLLKQSKASGKNRISSAAL